MQGILASSTSSSCFSSSFPSYNLRPHSSYVPARIVLPSSKGHHHRFPYSKQGFTSAAINLRKIETSQRKGRSSYGVVRASANDSNHPTSIAPFQPESPIGQMLVQLLQSHPHLVSAAAEQQLDQLAEDRDAASTQEQRSGMGTEIVLYRKIAELKVRERKKALEEIIYALIVQKFVAANVSMVPKLRSCSSFSTSDKIDSWPMQDKELESVHSPEVLEMVQKHLALVLGGRDASDYIDRNIVAQIIKLRVGQVYAASAMYGYFLRRVDQRFQLEKSMKILPPDIEDAIDTEQPDAQRIDTGKNNKQDNLAAEAAAAVAAMARARGRAMRQDLNPTGFVEDGMNSNKLGSYVLSFGAETLKTYASVRSKEGMNVIEKQTEALFGRPETQILPDGSMALVKEEVIKLSIGGLRRLVLEAVAFGSFLWDVESHVDSLYNFV